MRNNSLIANELNKTKHIKTLSESLNQETVVAHPSQITIDHNVQVNDRFQPSPTHF